MITHVQQAVVSLYYTYAAISVGVIAAIILAGSVALGRLRVLESWRPPVACVSSFNYSQQARGLIISPLLIKPCKRAIKIILKCSK